MFEMAILVPETLCQQATNAILALNQAHPLPDTLSVMVQSALQRGAERFVDAYLDEDEDLVEAMAQDEQLFANLALQEAFLVTEFGRGQLVKVPAIGFLLIGQHAALARADAGTRHFRATGQRALGLLRQGAEAHVANE